MPYDAPKDVTAIRRWVVREVVSIFLQDMVK
jgi:hypothetical protein